MLKKYLFIIPLFLLEVMVQLGFFWLAPAYECRWVVYAFLTVMTVAHLVVTYVLMVQHGPRKAAATIVAGSFIQALNIGATIFLLAVNSTIRSASFLMLMLMVLYVAIETILWISIEGFGNNMGNTTRDDQSDIVDDYDSYHESGCHEEVSVRPQRVNVPVENDRRYGVYHADVSSNRESARRTPPPVPVRH